MKRFVFALLLALPLAAQSPYRYSATTGDVSLTAAGTKFTIQQPASGAKPLQLETAVVYCSVACDITQARSGTAATTTAGTINTITYLAPTSAATVFTASNVGSGNGIGGIIHNQAANTLVIDLSKIVIPPGSTATNYTVIISSITGTANITFYWSERD